MDRLTRVIDRIEQCDAIARRIANGKLSPAQGGTEILLLVHDTEREAQERMAVALMRVWHGAEAA